VLLLLLLLLLACIATPGRRSSAIVMQKIAAVQERVPFDDEGAEDATVKHYSTRHPVLREGPMS